MINKNDISIFFNSVADAEKKSWEALMELPVKERIRKRKTIDAVFLHDEQPLERTEESKIILKISFEKNLSDFKEGDAIVLHDGVPSLGIICSLFSIIDDHNIDLEVYPPNLPNNWESYKNKSLFLDKSYVDLREFVFYNFLEELSNDSNFWKDNVVKFVTNLWANFTAEFHVGLFFRLR